MVRRVWCQLQYKKAACPLDTSHHQMWRPARSTSGTAYLLRLLPPLSLRFATACLAGFGFGLILRHHSIDEMTLLQELLHAKSCAHSRATDAETALSATSWLAEVRVGVATLAHGCFLVRVSGV